MAHDPGAPDTTLGFTRRIDAAPAAVWRCWTEPALICRWFTPEPVKTTRAEIDLRPGGRFRTVMEVPGHGTVDDTGSILLAEPGRRLVFTNAFAPDFQPRPAATGPGAFAFAADLSFAPDGGGTRYTVTVRHADAEGSRTHAEMGFHDGWGTATDQLEALARTL